MEEKGLLVVLGIVVALFVLRPVLARIPGLHWLKTSGPLGWGIPVFLVAWGLHAVVDNEIVRGALDAVMVGAVVEVLFQFAFFRGHFVEMLGEQLRAALLFDDGFLARVKETELKTIRRRVTETIVAGHFSPTGSLYDFLADKDLALLTRAYARDTVLHRSYFYETKNGSDPVWRVEQRHTYTYVNPLDCEISHVAKGTLVFKRPLTERSPIGRSMILIGDQQVALKDMSTENEMIWHWQHELHLAPHATVDVVRIDTRYVALDDFYVFRPTAARERVSVMCVFDRDVRPVLRYHGYQDRPSDTPICNDASCSFYMCGWMLPHHSLSVTWSPPDT